MKILRCSDKNLMLFEAIHILAKRHGVADTEMEALFLSDVDNPIFEEIDSISKDLRKFRVINGYEPTHITVDEYEMACDKFNNETQETK